jgi:hypothetical protein
VLPVPAIQSTFLRVLALSTGFLAHNNLFTPYYLLIDPLILLGQRHEAIFVIESARTFYRFPDLPRGFRHLPRFLISFFVNHQLSPSSPESQCPT